MGHSSQLDRAERVQGWLTAPPSLCTPRQDVGLVDDAKEAGYYAGWMLAAPQLARVRLWGDHSCRANNTVPG
jgi:hypothetical protein